MNDKSISKNILSIQVNEAKRLYKKFGKHKMMEYLMETGRTPKQINAIAKHIYGENDEH